MTMCKRLWHDALADARHPDVDHVCGEDKGHEDHIACICLICRAVRRGSA